MLTPPRRWGAAVFFSARGVLLALFIIAAIFAGSLGRTADPAWTGVVLGSGLVAYLAYAAVRHGVRSRHRRRDVARESAEAAAHELPGARPSPPSRLTFGGDVGQPSSGA